jgi:hypothetical protein
LAALSLAGGPASTQTSRPETCQSRISTFVVQNARPQGRFVLTFTGTQRALQPLWEDISGSDAETTLFPIDRTTFVLTIRTGVAEPRLTKSELDGWAGRICNLAAAHGARYNGALAYSAADNNEMTEADMSPPPVR